MTIPGVDFAAIFQPVLDFLKSIWEAVCSLGVAILKWFIGLYTWLKTETLNQLYNFGISCFEQIIQLCPFNVPVNESILAYAYVNLNIFFPLDDLLIMILFLLETWITIRFLKFGFFLFKPNIRKF